MIAKDLLRQELNKHWPWIVGLLFTVGVTYGALTFKQNSMEKTLNSNAVGLQAHGVQITAIEKNVIELHAADNMAMQKLDTISSDIKDLKTTVEKLDEKMNERITRMTDKTQVQLDEIKKLVYKPAIGTTYIHDSKSDIASKVEGLIK